MNEIEADKRVRNMMVKTDVVSKVLSALRASLPDAYQNDNLAPPRNVMSLIETAKDNLSVLEDSLRELESDIRSL